MGISIEEYRELIKKQNSGNNRGKDKHDPARQLQGRLNRELGKIFEDTVDTICEIYEMNGLARIEKTPEPMKVLKYLESRKI